MRFEVVVINYNFYNAKMSLALSRKLPALLGILGIWQVGEGGTSGELSVSRPRGPIWQGNQRGGGKKLILIT